MFKIRNVTTYCGQRGGGLPPITGPLLCHVSLSRRMINWNIKLRNTLACIDLTPFHEFWGGGFAESVLSNWSFNPRTCGALSHFCLCEGGGVKTTSSAHSKK